MTLGGDRPEWTIRDRIRRARIHYAEKTGAPRTTQSEFDRVLGVSHGSVAHWESAQSVPTPAQLVRVSEVAGVDLDWLLTGLSATLRAQGLTSKEVEVAMAHARLDVELARGA